MELKPDVGGRSVPAHHRFPPPPPPPLPRVYARSSFDFFFQGIDTRWARPDTPVDVLVDFLGTSSVTEEPGDGDGATWTFWLASRGFVDAAGRKA